LKYVIINKGNILFNNLTSINVTRIDRKRKRKYIIGYRFFVWHRPMFDILEQNTLKNYVYLKITHSSWGMVHFVSTKLENVP
jgi:hypothetical protein